jgi:hypothetical protein
MIEVEIVREYKGCWRVGQRREVSDEFAYVLIEGGYARKVEPEMAEMIKIADKFRDIGQKIKAEPQTPVVETGKT